MEQREGQSAAVIMPKGHGEERLRQALQQGLVRKELEQDFQEVIANIEKLKIDNRYAKDRISELQKELGNYKQVYYDALRAKQREDARRERWQNAKIITVVAASMFVIVFLCVFICRLIFG